MPLIAFGLRRAIVLKLMPKAFKSGITRTAFYNRMKLKGLGYAKSKFLGDWRSKFNIEDKKDTIKYIRKDRLPSPKFMADVSWKYDKEYIYKANTWSRIRPDEPLTERMVTFTSDIPLTSREVEEQIATKWAGFDKYIPEKLERVQTTAVYHKVPSAIEGE